MSGGGVSEGHYLLGIAGLALLRAGAERRPGSVASRVAEIEAVAAGLADPEHARARELPARDVEAGYAAWADSYDDPGNDLIEVEEPIVRPLLDGLPPGAVLDAACGTGRHAAHLVAQGREVVGVDASEAMLSRARTALPGVELRRGDLTALPVEDASVTGAVCALALSHLPELGPAVAELGRVLRPGGRLVISNPHPLAIGLLGWRAVFTDEAGRRATIPEFAHRAAGYVSAFGAAGLVVRRLLEPGLTAEQARRRGKGRLPGAFEQALTGLPAVIVWEVERPKVAFREEAVTAHPARSAADLVIDDRSDHLA